jgi:mono/diheme cytochrome c family protein
LRASSIGGVALALVGLAQAPVRADSAAGATLVDTQWQFLQQYCSRCHNDERMTADLTLSSLSTADPAAGRNVVEWEKILRMASQGEMPPRNRPQPTPEARAAFTRWLESALDEHAAAHPDPGRATLRRLNRNEYANAVRDLLALRVDASGELPADDTGYGFDNIADVLSVSPTLMDRYLTVAGKLSRLAVGLGPRKPYVATYAVLKAGSIKNQGIPAYDERASDELPLYSRGGAAFRYYAPYDATYEISGYLNANTNNEVDRLPENRVSLRVKLAAGPHSIGITFRRQLALDETVQTLHNTTEVVVMPTQPPMQLPLDFVVDGAPVGETTVPSYHMSPRFSQANFPRDVLQIDVEGPFDVTGAGDTPSRRKIFVCQPKKASAEEACARKILTGLARQAYRRPVGAADVDPLMKVYAAARSEADFEQGIESAIEAVLVSPSFLFLHEQDPPGSTPGSVHAISDLGLASRLALFLWSSLPDDELLSVAAHGQMRNPAVLEKQVARMLADPRAEALTKNFAGQWLYLRNLEYQRPDVFLFPSFDTRLRQAMKRETELFFASIVRENRSVLDFISADYSFLNERLAEHYGIEGIKGPALRKVSLDAGSRRGGLLGQGSILTVTSYGNHTSVVKRGKWILDNLLSAPPPPPPPDVPALKSTSSDGRKLSAREQLEQHRADPACASCHVKMDPLGYALESYDAVGAFRTEEDGRALDVSATLPDGTQFDGLAGLQKVLLSRKDQFTRAFTERLLTYALGRGVGAHDQPAIRAIARAAAKDDYRIHTIILGIVQSEPFNLRKTPET